MVKINSSISSSEIEGIKKFALKATFLFLPVLIFVAATNFLVDPAHLYNNRKLEEGIAEILASGHNVGRITGYDDRLVQKCRIAIEKDSPDIAVIGSSRSMQIGTNIFPDKHVINYSLSSAALGDYLWILFNYERKGIFPRTIILGVDPWTLNLKSEADSLMSFNKDTLAMLKKLGITSRSFKTPLIPPKIANLFSFSYFQKAIETIIENKSVGVAYFSTNQEIADYAVMLQDGRLSYSKSARTRPVEEVEKEAINTAIYGQGEIFNFREPDRERANILEKLVLYLQSRHINVVFFLSPYHPTVYNSFLVSDQKKVIVEIENYYRDFAKRHHLKILGSYDPSKVDLLGKDFYDSDHPSKEGVEKIFRQGW